MQLTGWYPCGVACCLATRPDPMAAAACCLDGRPCWFMRELAPTEFIPVAACIRDVLEGCRERFRCVGGGLNKESHSSTNCADKYYLMIMRNIF